jgi:hypothetical protein
MNTWALSTLRRLRCAFSGADSPISRHTQRREPHELIAELDLRESAQLLRRWSRASPHGHKSVPDSKHDLTHPQISIWYRLHWSQGEINRISSLPGGMGLGQHCRSIAVPTWVHTLMTLSLTITTIQTSIYLLTWGQFHERHRTRLPR